MVLFARGSTSLATSYVLASCASVQVGSALAARLMTSTGSEGATALRLGLAALALLALTRPRVRGWTHAQWTAALALGLCLAGMNGSFYLALARIPLGAAVTLEFLGPLTLSAVMSTRRRDLGWVVWALGGVILLGGLPSATGGGLDPVGVALALLAGVFWALYILAASRVGATTPGLGGLAVATAAAAAVALPFGLPGASVLLTHPELIGLAMGTALLASIIPYSLELGAIRRLPPRTFGILMSLEPAVAAVVGWALLGQGVAWPAAVGIAMVVSASAGATLSARPARTEASAAA
ncbi:MAG: EamA family transporter [Myxococcota bacterium]